MTGFPLRETLAGRVLGGRMPSRALVRQATLVRKSFYIILAFYIISIPFVITDKICYYGKRTRVKTAAAQLRLNADDASVVFSRFALAAPRGNARKGPR